MDNDEPILKASEFIAYKRAHGQLDDFPAPQAVLFLPQASLAKYVLRRHSSRRVKGFLGGFHVLKRTDGQIAVSTDFGVGAPAIAGLTDEFAALGVKQFALIGLAGGLQRDLSAGSLVISNRAIRGEGVSRHYLPSNSTVDSSENLVHGLSELLTKQNHNFSVGTTWTTDAPFREIRRDVVEYQRQGVLAVDMEAAALLSVAASLNLSAIAAFSIADLLSDGVWRTSHNLRPAQTGLTLLFDAVYEYFTNQLRK